MEEKINHPEHYHYGTYEAIKVIEAWGLGFCLGNVVKYISRAGRKVGADELEDLKKAQWYLNREIEKREIAIIKVDIEAGSTYTKDVLRDGFLPLTHLEQPAILTAKEYQSLSRPKL